MALQEIAVEVLGLVCHGTRRERFGRVGVVGASTRCAENLVLGRHFLEVCLKTLILDRSFLLGRLEVGQLRFEILDMPFFALPKSALT